jgi:anti-anti-sigma factor
MELIEDMNGAVKVARVSGRIDQTTAAQFQELLAPLLVQVKVGAAPLLLDFSGVDYISSVGLRVLMLAAKQVKVQQGKIAIAALTPVVAEVFQISRFHLVFPVHPDLATAVTSLA